LVPGNKSVLSGDRKESVKARPEFT
jgi:hypothetical protein